MYESYFGFSESPFENNLDHRFLFISDDHKEVLAALSYFIKTKKGFAIICGDVGTGKTMLINSFLSTLPEYVQPIIVANPGVTSLELLRYIAKTLEIEVKEKEGILELTDAVKELLKEAKSLNKQFVLIIDEAHLLSDQALEEIRLLSNIETQEQKLLQILLVGQYELSYKLDRLEMRHLRQRININRFLSPMNASETIQYVDHRLRQVGSSFSVIFEDNCGRAIYKITGGVPRNINQLGDNALLVCMSEKRQKVDRGMLRQAQEALLTDRLFTPKFAQRTGPRRRQLPRVLAWAAVCATFLVLGIVLSQTYFSGPMGQQLSREASPLPDLIPDQKAAAVTSGRVKEVPETAGRESAAKVVSRGHDPSPNAPIIPAGPQTVSPETPGAANLTPSSQPQARELAAVVPKVSASTGAGPQSGLISEKTASPALSSPPGQPPPVVAPAGWPGQVKESDAASDGTLKPAFIRWEVKRGETLGTIASQAYRGSEKYGIEAVLLDNPEIRNRDLIHPGQVVFLPRINPKRQTIQLRDNLFYTYYGLYGAGDDMNRVSAMLEKQEVRYTIIANHSRGRKGSHHILLGGYETMAGLQSALDLVKAQKK